MISAIVLAAGRSRRMGTQKLLLPLDGRPMIARIVAETLASPVDRVLVVVGDDRPRIEQALAGRPVEFVANPDIDGDMLGSIRCGLRALSAGTDAVLIVLGDQPGISREVVAELVQRFRAGGQGIVLPTFDGKRGHPLLFSARYCAEILHEHDDVGLRGLLQSHGEDVAETAVSSPAVLEDVDLPEDYRRIAGQMPGEDAPS